SEAFGVKISRQKAFQAFFEKKAFTFPIPNAEKCQACICKQRPSVPAIPDYIIPREKRGAKIPLVSVKY
ncbi:MAG: hypothetical protein JXR70_03475, partial [Spirochaetales bacterium]|nr:hypothetical protein [Spirochaetales bacterium]